MNLSHNTRKTLPPELGDFSTTLLHLEMSNNQLASIPESIGALMLLQSLDVSLNQIESIDGAIGKCVRLRRLNVSKNRLETLPAEIGSCILLVSDVWSLQTSTLDQRTGSACSSDAQEEVIASNNQLEFLPHEMLRLFVLSMLDLRNNRLSKIPTELSRVVRRRNSRDHFDNLHPPSHRMLHDINSRLSASWA